MRWKQDMERKWEEIGEWQGKAFHNLVHLIRWLINSLWSHFIRKHKNDKLCLLPLLLLWQNVGQRQEKKRLRWLTVDVEVMAADARGRRSHHICYQEAEKHAQLAFLCVRPSPTPSPTDYPHLVFAYQLVYSRKFLPGPPRDLSPKWF